MIALILLACGSGGGPAKSVEVAPEPIGLAECEVCRMVVREQPAPRGQAVYRDGTHAHVCSIEELRALAQHPGPRGHPVGLFVEVLPGDFDPAAPVERAEHPWAPVAEVSFVFGADRPGVMGEPVLTFTDSEAALRVAGALSSRPMPWSALEQTPFHQIP